MASIMFDLLASVAAVTQLMRWLNVASVEDFRAGRVFRAWMRWLRLDHGAQASAIGSLLLLTPLRSRALELIVVVFLIATPRSLTARFTVPSERTRATTSWLIVGFTAPVMAVAPIIGYRQGAVLAPLVIACASMVSHPVIGLLDLRAASAARRRCGRSNGGPIVVGVTGSFGKSSTVSYIDHLLSDTARVASTQSNDNGLRGAGRTLLAAEGADWAVVEVGLHYGRDVRDVAEAIRPAVAVITAVAANHLERMRSLEAVSIAKAHIADHATTVIIGINGEEAERTARRLESDGRQVVRAASGGREADVMVWRTGHDLVVRIGRETVSLHAPLHIYELALGCALGFAVFVAKTSLADVVRRIPSLPGLPGHHVLERSPTGFYLIDNTAPSNPVSAERSITMLQTLAGDRSRVIVCTPGWFELGCVASIEHLRLARSLGDVATDVILYGRSNRRSLLRGLRGSKVRVLAAPDQVTAAAFARARATVGDVVLLENRLPPHMP